MAPPPVHGFRVGLVGKQILSVGEPQAVDLIVLPHEYLRRQTA